MIFLSDSVVRLSDFPSYVIPLAQINPLYLIIRILMVIEWGNIEPWDKGMDWYCEYYYLWLDYYQFRTELFERTEGFNCDRLNDTKYDFIKLHDNITNMTFEKYIDTLEIFVNNISVPDIDLSPWEPTRDPDPDMFCQHPITSSMIFNQLEVDPDLFGQWIFQLIAVAVLLRVLAVVFLWVSNVEGFSWIRKHLVYCLCFLCSQKEVWHGLG